MFDLALHALRFQPLAVSIGYYTIIHSQASGDESVPLPLLGFLLSYRTIFKCRSFMQNNHGGLRLTVLLGVCAGLPALSIDLSAPALASLPTELNTSVLVAGLSLSLFMAGFGVGQFGGGRASDRHGRRPVILLSLLLYSISGLCCAMATTGGELATARLVQGIGAGACAVQAPAIIQDLFLGEEARRRQSSVSIVLTVVPMLAPSLGALLLAFASWRAPFAALAVAGMVLAGAVVLQLGESKPAASRRQTSGLGFRDSSVLLRQNRFTPIVLINGLSYGTIFAYIAGSPVIVIGWLGYPTGVYVALFAATAVALTTGATCNAILARKGVGSAALVWPALVAQTGATIGLALVGRYISGIGALLAVPPLLVCAFARGIIAPNMVHLAISEHREQAGLASALVGLTQLLLGAGASAAVAAVLPTFGYSGVAVIMATLSIVATLLWKLLVRPGDQSSAISS